DQLLPQRIRRFIEVVAGAGRGDLQDLAVRIREVDAPEPAPVVGTGDGYAAVGEPALPLEQTLLGRDAEGQVMDPADAPTAPHGPRPLEEGQDRARRARLVSEIQMVGARVVVVDRLLHQA